MFTNAIAGFNQRKGDSIMGKKEQIQFNDEAMKEIVADYQSCINLLSDMIKYNKSAKSNFDHNYDGVGKEITDSAFDKFEQHLNLLSSCNQSMHDFVTDAWDTMKKADDTLAGKR